MNIIPTSLAGCLVVEPRVFADERGYFFESFNAAAFGQATGQHVAFVQDNESFSRYGTIRGLHAQAGDAAQAKLVRVLSGKVLDVVVDARAGSATFGQYAAVELSADNKRQLFVPRGCLHGFSVLSETATFFYKCDNYYEKSAEIGVSYKDLDLGIDWGIPLGQEVVSDKDQQLPAFSQVFG